VSQALRVSAEEIAKYVSAAPAEAASSPSKTSTSIAFSSPVKPSSASTCSIAFRRRVDLSGADAGVEFVAGTGAKVASTSRSNTSASLVSVPLTSCTAAAPDRRDFLVGAGEVPREESLGERPRFRERVEILDTADGVRECLPFAFFFVFFLSSAVPFFSFFFFAETSSSSSSSSSPSSSSSSASSSASSP
jgi:hypothetical protein